MCKDSRAYKKVSVIVPAYNCERTIAQCISSICVQTYNDLEIIAIDDGSSDHTLERLYILQEQDVRLKIIHQENRGVSSARNEGIRASTGEYLTFVDSDDYIESTMIECCMKSLERVDIDISCCGFFVHNKGKIYNVKKYENIICTNLEALNFYKPYYYGSMWGKIYKRSILQNNHDELRLLDNDIFYSEDELFWCKAVLAAQNVAHIAQPLYHYIINSNSASHLKMTDKKLTRFEAWNRICEEVRGVPELLQQARCKQFENCVLLLREAKGTGYLSDKSEVMEAFVKQYISLYQCSVYKKKKIILWYMLARYLPLILIVTYKIKGMVRR
ncbi:MAG: hypothetical protein K0R92_1261 [Lachnospiraceae bacterium]|jgi:glycosyltransferase involved in cell wall biosynthesis|nr:hypothetical protein [Lachnospiraceae bacterium]MDF2843391.1 hypothetical protein [Herbinix sp.]